MSHYPPGAVNHPVINGPVLGRIRCTNIVATVLDWYEGEVAGGCDEVVCDWRGDTDLTPGPDSMVGECPKCGGEIVVEYPERDWDLERDRRDDR